MYKFLLLVLVLLIVNCSRDTQELEKLFEQLTYSQSEWSERDYGIKAEPHLEDLLKMHAPSFWIQEKACGPMDFYTQYVPLLKIWRNGEQVGFGSRANLKKYERDFSVSYRITDPPDCVKDQKPPLYAYAWQESMELLDGKKVPIKVLKYAFTFYKSGLPAHLGFIQGLGLFGHNDFWHYLDIHGAVFFMLDQNDRIFAIVLAQHNHFRTFIVGRDVTPGKAIDICFASRSNEPYLCSDSSDKFPTAPTWQSMRFIMTGKGKPFLGAYDLVPRKNKAVRISYFLEFLPQKDPLISSWVPLGPEIKIWGIFSSFFRRSPPGMAIFTSPALMPFSKTAQYFYFDPDNQDAFKIHEENMDDFANPSVEPVLSINRCHFLATLKKNGFFLDN